MTGFCCPYCNAPELKDAQTLNIRAHKVCDEKGLWWSQCLVCAPTRENGGWFSDIQVACKAAGARLPWEGWE